MLYQIYSIPVYCYPNLINSSHYLTSVCGLFSASYPETAPGIIIRSGSSELSPNDVDTLQNYVSSSAEEHVGSAMIFDLVDAARSWLKDHTSISEMSPPEATEQEAASRTKPKKTSKAKKRNRQKAEADTGKKLPMKTAADVISRIVWDEQLPADSFTIGYTDRFRGVIEMNFSAFSWEDIASVDNTVLAIPQHRIQYFKYCTVKVWDKNERLDDVFGSTGSAVTITDVMAKYEVENSLGTETVSRNSCDDYDDVHDSDGIPGIVANVQTPCSDKCNNKLRPNYFLCLRITDSNIVERLEALQESILEVEPQYAECCVRPTALHVTLCTLGLDTLEQVSSARRVLEDACRELRAMAPRNIVLTIKGVSNFSDRVIYGQVHHEQDFTDFVERIRTTFCESGFDMRDDRDYVPHMTVVKVSRPTERRLLRKTIDPAIYETAKDMYFGSETISAVHLCSMKERTQDGFYVCAARVDLLEVEQ